MTTRNRFDKQHQLDDTTYTSSYTLGLMLAYERQEFPRLSDYYSRGWWSAKLVAQYDVANGWLDRDEWPDLAPVHVAQRDAENLLDALL